MNLAWIFFHICICFTTGQADDMFRLWQRQNYFNKPPDGYIPVSRILQDGHFELRQCMQVVKGTLKCLHGLHVRGLVQKDLDIEDVYVKKASHSVSMCKSMHHIL